MKNILLSKRLIAFPRGFFSLLIILTLTMMGFALMQSLLASYCVEALNLSNHTANALNGAFIVCVFSMPVLGGYIAGKFLGFNFATLASLIIAILGLYIACFQGVNAFYTGMALFCVGNSISVACLYVSIGKLLKASPKMRTGGFTLIYTCMNAGAFAALLISNMAVMQWGYQTTFLISAVLFILALLTFIANLHNYNFFDLESSSTYTKLQRMIGLTALFLLAPTTLYIFYNPKLTHTFLLTMILIAAAFFTHTWRRSSAINKRKLFIFLTVSAFAVCFWALYGLEPSVLRTFLEHHVDRSIAHFAIPSSEFFTLNPLFIIILGATFTGMWLRLDKHHLSPTLPYKFAIGIGCVGTAYLLLSASTYFSDQVGLIGMEWVVICYAFLSAAELLISPIGLAMVGRLSTPESEGPMMGIWLLSNGIGSSLSIYLSSMSIYADHALNPLNTNELYGYRFCEFGLCALAIAVILSLLSPKLIKNAI